MRKSILERAQRLFRKGERLPATLALMSVVLLAAWMGTIDGGYFASEWILSAFALTVLVLIVSVAGALRGTRHRAGILALGLFAAYAAWTFASLLWSPNGGDAWLGAGQTLLYLLVFWVTVALVGMDASRRLAMVASALGPAAVAVLTLWTLDPSVEGLFKGDRLTGTVGYHNGEAAFLLVPFWVAVYLAGSRRVNPLLRGVLLAGAILSADLAVLTQSRGAMVAMALSLPVFFLFSAQRLRGLLALLPIAVALLITFPGLNDVYLAFLNSTNPAVALERILPTVWLTAAGAGLYGLAWGLVDRRWRPSEILVRIARIAVVTCCAIALVAGTSVLYERTGDPVALAQQKWASFKVDDKSGLEQSRYMSASGSGRYTLWQVAWKDFAAHPIVGVGTQNYEATYYQLREQDVGSVRQPHMLPLEVLSERGLVGGGLFFGFLGICLVTGLWGRFGHLRSEGKAQVGALLAAITYWFVHSSAEWFWQMPAVTLPAIFYLALLVAPWRRRNGGLELSGWPPRALGLAAAMLVLMVLVPLYISERYLSISHEVADRSQALVAVERAQQLNPLNSRLPRREAELAIEVGDWNRVKAAYEREIRLDPHHYAPHMSLATFYERRGEFEKALVHYRKAAHLNPLDESLQQSVTRLREAASAGT